MTKEAVLEKYYEQMFSSQKYEKRVNRKMDERWVMPAMDEFAKQQSVSFLGWFFKTTMEQTADKNHEQLYDLFTQHQQKK